MTLHARTVVLVVCGMLAAALGNVAVVFGQSAAEKNGNAASDVNQQLTETIGVLAGLHLYQTYLNIGFVADGKAEGTYEEAEARLLLASILTLFETVEKQLEKVGKLTPHKRDQEALAKIRKLAVLVRQQGKQLETFWNTGADADGAKYEAARKTAWDGISALLGLNKTPLIPTVR